PGGSRIARPKAELGVDPPDARFEHFVVAELIRVDAERGGTEHVMQRGEPARERECRFAAAKAVEGVECRPGGITPTSVMAKPSPWSTIQASRASANAGTARQAGMP